VLEVGTGHGYQTELLARLTVPAASRDHRPYR
jgi:protein-L-isoaspartate O-methyltransferase